MDKKLLILIVGLVIITLISVPVMAASPTNPGQPFDQILDVVIAIQTKMDTVLTYVQDVQTKLNTVLSQLTTLQSSVDDLNDFQANVDEDFISVENSLTTIQTGVNTLSTQQTSLQTSMESNFNDVDTSLGEVNNDLNDVKNSLGTIQTSLDDLTPTPHKVKYHTALHAVQRYDADSGTITHLEIGCRQTSRYAADPLDVDIYYKPESIWEKYPEDPEMFVLGYENWYHDYLTLSPRTDMLYSPYMVEITTTSTVVCNVCFESYQRLPASIYALDCYKPGDLYVEILD
jgi:archaellum component FlaC